MKTETPYTLIILPGRGDTRGHDHRYASAYETFQLVWSQTFQEVSGRKNLYSDDFTRQDYIQALFKGDVCVALDCVREVDLGRRADLEDSWLSDWKPELIGRISGEFGPKTLINSYFTVHPDYRRTRAGAEVSVCHVMGCITALHFEELRYRSMLGMTRNNRSMDKSTHRWGAVSVDTGIIHHGINTDLILFTEANVRMAKRSFPTEALEIFDSKIDTFKGRSHEIAA